MVVLLQTGNCLHLFIMIIHAYLELAGFRCLTSTPTGMAKKGTRERKTFS